MFKPSDKGGAVVVWRQNLYIKEAETQLSDTSFQWQIDHDITSQQQSPIQSFITLNIGDDNHLLFKYESIVLGRVCAVL